MDILQWLFIIGVAITIIFLICSVYFFITFIMSKSNIKKTGTASKQKKAKKRISRLKKQKNKALIRGITCLLLGAMVGSLSAYVTYYQATNLSTEDMENIKDGFYYLRDLEKELEGIQKGKTDEEKANQTINFVVTSLAGYSVKKASTLNTIDGQRVLNRYYQGMSELGINVSRKSAMLSSDKLSLKEALSDIQKIKNYEKQVLIFYKVDESILESKR
ncbi:hypothetical protein [Vagococcus fluvialis]|uniref:hypothetical protein n=1 Tax=Vagococcus fluvialis TaxID=2738 RepID=UPI003B5A8AED